MLRGYITCVLQAPSSSALQILFSFSIDIWNTTVCTPDEVMVWMRGEFTPPPTAPYAGWMNSRKTPSFLCPTSSHMHITLLQTFPLGFLVRTPLHCPTKPHVVRSSHFSIWLLICCLFCYCYFQRFPLLSSIPFIFLTSF